MVTSVMGAEFCSSGFVDVVSGALAFLPHPELNKMPDKNITAKINLM
jgi:hypothetical protein